MMMKRSGVLVVFVGLILSLGHRVESKPSRSDRRAMEDAEACALEKYGEKDFAGALSITDEALTKHTEGKRADAASWDEAALRVLYMKAISLRELGMLESARLAMASLAEQGTDKEVQKRAQAALDQLVEPGVDAYIYCPTGVTFQLYSAGARTTKDRGKSHSCGGNRPTRFTIPPGEYRIGWSYGFDSSTRALRLELGQQAHVHLVKPPKAPTAPGDSGAGGCLSAGAGQ